jgi:protein farnesyltransferase subunit beta
MDGFDGFGMEGLAFPTDTSSAQWELELTARDIYARAVRHGAGGGITEVGSGDGEGGEGGGEDGEDAVGGDFESGREWEGAIAVLKRDEHVQYLYRSLRVLSAGHVVLDASRCWLCYWIVHSLALLGQPVLPDVAADIVEFLALCQHPKVGLALFTTLFCSRNTVHTHTHTHRDTA